MPGSVGRNTSILLIGARLFATALLGNQRPCMPPVSCTSPTEHRYHDFVCTHVHGRTGRYFTGGWYCGQP
jgi:hypothetical protein